MDTTDNSQLFDSQEEESREQVMTAATTLIDFANSQKHMPLMNDDDQDSQKSPMFLPSSRYVANSQAELFGSQYRTQRRDILNAPKKKKKRSITLGLDAEITRKIKADLTICQGSLKRLQEQIDTAIHLIEQVRSDLPRITEKDQGYDIISFCTDSDSDDI
jgi:hypothetical protein